jgi:putative spermidine/putrescine transport system permease protein
MAGNRSERLLGTLGSIFTLAIALYLLTPLIIVTIISFDSRTLIGTLPPPSLTLRWYVDFFANPSFTSALANSLAISGIATVGAVLTGITTAYLLVRYSFRGRELLNTVFLSPLIVPGVATGFAFLGYFSIIGPDIAFERLLIANLLLAFPYTVRTITATLVGFDSSIEEAGMTLGASRLSAFVEITLPTIKTGLIAAAVFAFAMTLNDVSINVFLVSPQTTTFSVALFSAIKYGYTPSIAAASVILIGFAFVVIVAIELLLGLDKFTGIGGFNSSAGAK